jgi:hypothetical protein
MHREKSGANYSTVSVIIVQMAGRGRLPGGPFCPNQIVTRILENAGQMQRVLRPGRGQFVVLVTYEGPQLKWLLRLMIY